MKKIILLGAISLGILSLQAQSQSWILKSNLGGDDYANFTVPGENGTQYIVGSTSATGGGGYDAFVSKLDTGGVAIWTKQFGGSGTEYGTHIINTTDGNLLFVGRSNSGLNSQDIFAVKLDTAGNTLWANTYGTDSADYGFRVVEGVDGYLFVGQTRKSPQNRLDAILVKVNYDGTLAWSNTFGSEYGNETAYDAVQMDSGFVIAGYTGINNIGAGMNDGIFFAIDYTGNLQAAFEFGGNGDEDIRVIVPDQGAVYFVGQTRSFGTNNQEIFVAKYNTQNSGLPTFSWFKTYGGSQSESVTSAKMLEDGKLLITGLTASFGQGGDGLIMLLDTSGTVQLAKHIGGNGNDVIMDVNTGDGVSFIGYSDGFSSASDVLFVKPGDGGSFACLANDAAITGVTQTVINAGPGSIPPDFSINPVTVVLNANNTSNTGTYTDSLICKGSGQTAISNIENKIKFSVYPNPANTSIAVEFLAAENSTTSISIFDARGEVVQNIANESKQGKNIVNVSLNSLSEGMYFVKLKIGISESFSRFVVAR